MIESLWRLGDLGVMSGRPFFAFVLTAGERLWSQAGGGILRPAVELAWRRAEREASDDEISRQLDEFGTIYSDAFAANDWQLGRVVNVLALLFREPGSAARTLVFPHPISDPGESPVPLLSPAELKDCCRLIREFFSNGVPPNPDPAWLTSSVVALARQMYDRRDFAPMPILADALQDAGCDHADVLAHCRAGGPHVRGCWVVDLLLGKA
jgi:hypothetical protein